MKVNFFTKLFVVLVLSAGLVAFSLAIAYAQARDHVATGVLTTGSGGITGRGSGDYALAGGTLAIHSAYAEYEEESVFAGFSLVTKQTAPGGGVGQDAGIFVGGGIGKKGHSLELTLTIADVSQFQDFLISAKYQFLSETSSRPAMAIGVEAINEIPTQLERSPYIVASKSFLGPRIPIVASLGWGAGRFGNNFFGALTFIITRSWTLIAEYDGLGGNIGTSFVVKMAKGQSPIVVTAGIQDIFLSEYESTLTLGAGIKFR